VRGAAACGSCTRCVDFCPPGLELADIGLAKAHERCIECLYCWWACPKDALALPGEHGFMERPIERYKGMIEGL
jgi:Fe-S-cluster-containing dehydrogenase component